MLTKHFRSELFDDSVVTVIQRFKLLTFNFSLGLGLDANANQNKETKAMLTSMKLIKTITTHYYLLHDYTRFYSYFAN
jgi:hypothetical protein